jgi:hypothetical protein
VVASGGFTRERGKARYRKRKPIPAIVIAVLLIVAAIVVWTKVIAKASDVNAAVACPAPAATAAVTKTPKPQPGTVLPYDALDKVAPEPAGEVTVQVYNASTKLGAATQASIELKQDGFQVPPAADDPLYPKHDMKCRGQIRFGANGESAARTVSLLVPCTQLVRDNRQDASVDLAIGTDFTTLTPSNQAQQAIQQLAQWAAQHPTAQGGQQAQNSVLPQLNPDLLSQAHSSQC